MRTRRQAGENVCSSGIVFNRTLGHSIERITIMVFGNLYIRYFPNGPVCAKMDRDLRTFRNHLRVQSTRNTVETIPSLEPGVSNHFRGHLCADHGSPVHCVEKGGSLPVFCKVGPIRI